MKNRNKKDEPKVAKGQKGKGRLDDLDAKSAGEGIKGGGGKTGDGGRTTGMVGDGG